MSKPIVSDALGFGAHQLAEMEADRKMNGFSSVEFKPDPHVPEFIQVHCESRRDFDRYTKHRGYVQKSGMGGVRLTQAQLDRAAAMVSRVIEERKYAELQ